ncbi:GNAT family N-acetyltransferase [Flavisolibacter ginsengisoli]|jgi:RimJ/RimL family protein N-acetyltransferase|uniref:Protein N-acetyltransferase, RimJ/RimL family n=1 Tax=Flavisolibacter ginsengisoli DSM 18119 TaxID=1121884 RepID=A0A1M4VG25_9BACT|nr:GNAT family N-acetyltransferase [Flavisolibacter ginsengisoli]SHE67917.1 Protein N-acetyltransferase, RimJ/RimL family [Flavisolibacter ginsengisoli DSM 18119]
MNLKLRLARATDLQMIFRWANDPVVRANAFNPHQITLEDHTKWYNEKMKNRNTIFLILEMNDEPAGQIRYELQEDEIIINYMIATEYRGHGLGNEILGLGEKYLAVIELPENIHKIVGYVKKENIASLKAFNKNNYLCLENEGQNHSGSFRFEKLIQRNAD